ncbi:MAG: hypothetical protein IJ751_09490 [Oscillospiraceae bacterium]|nr:hypothetical protein [Oscillospiraceae bacterium]
MSSPKGKKKNKYGWDRRRIITAVIAGGMCLLLLIPLITQVFLYAGM